MTQFGLHPVGELKQHRTHIGTCVLTKKAIEFLGVFYLDSLCFQLQPKPIVGRRWSAEQEVINVHSDEEFLCFDLVGTWVVLDWNATASLDGLLQTCFPMASCFEVAIKCFVQFAAWGDPAFVDPFLWPQFAWNPDVCVVL